MNKFLMLGLLLLLASCVSKNLLNNSIFCNYPILTESMEVNAFRYHFDKHQYEIHLLNNDSGHFREFVIEKGDYRIAEDKLTLSPRTILICKDTIMKYENECAHTLNFDVTYLLNLNKDTISKSNPLYLNFKSRVLNIEKKELELFIRDTKFSHVSVVNSKYCK